MAQYGGLGGMTGLYAIPIKSCFTAANSTNIRLDGDPMYSLTRAGGNCVFDGYRVRSLTPVECERLMGFPDGWTAGFGDGIRRSMAGDAVMVPIVEHIGRLLLWDDPAATRFHISPKRQNRYDVKREGTEKEAATPAEST